MLLETPARRPNDSAEALLSPLDAALTERVVEFDLVVRVERALVATGYGVMRAVRVASRAGVVVLEGRVPSFHLKQLAQSAALAVPGVQQLRNDLEVVAPA